MCYLLHVKSASSVELALHCGHTCLFTHRLPVSGSLNLPRFASSEPDKLRLSLTTQASGWLRCFMNNSVGEDEHQFLMTVSGMSLSAEVSF